MTQVTEKDIEDALRGVEVATAPPQVISAGTALETFIDMEQVKRDLSINPADLDSAMLSHAGLDMHYSTCTAKARRQYERVKAAFEVLEARLNAHHRRALSEGAKKAPTVDQIRAEVIIDHRWVAANTRVIDAQHIYKMCEAVESSFRARKDLLLETARDRRKEREGELRVLGVQAARQAAIGAGSGS